MLTPKQTQIFGSFLTKPYAEKTYREIMEYTQEKSNSVVQKAITAFLSQGLITKRNVGNIKLYKADVQNNTTLSYFIIILQEKLSKSAKICVEQIRNEMREISFVSIVIFGSYSENKQTEKSDLDIALLVGTNKDKKDAEIAIKSAELKCVIPLDAHVFSKKEMLQMLSDRSENLGKQIARKHLAVHNPQIFYSILEEGIQHGFKIVY